MKNTSHTGPFNLCEYPSARIKTNPVAFYRARWAVREAVYMGGKGRGKAVAGKATIRVLVVDDHVIVRQGLRLIMDEEPDMEVAGEASSVEELMKKIRESEWDIVLLDITLPDRSGLEALKEIKAMRPHLPVLILSMHPEEQYASQALKKGASGYLSKESAAQEVVEAIRQVVGGGVYTGGNNKDQLSGKGADETRPAAARRRRPDTKRR